MRRRRLDAVDVAVREFTRLGQCRSHAGRAVKARRRDNDHRKLRQFLLVRATPRSPFYVRHDPAVDADDGDLHRDLRARVPR